MQRVLEVAFGKENGDTEVWWGECVIEKCVIDIIFYLLAAGTYSTRVMLIVFCSLESKSFHLKVLHCGQAARNHSTSRIL